MSINKYLNSNTGTPDSAQGWHHRATRTSADDFQPKASDLVFAAKLSAKGDPNGFTMALIRPNLAVDASGQLLILSTNDFAILEAHIRDVKEHVESSDVFGGQWRVKQPRTCYPFDEIVIPGDIERSVYGWSKSEGELDLEEETKGRTTLPKELQVLVGLAREARDGYVRGQGNEVLIGKIRSLF